MPGLSHACVLSIHSALATVTPPCRSNPPRPAKTTDEARLEPEISKAALSPASRRARACALRPTTSHSACSLRRSGSRDLISRWPRDTSSSSFGLAFRGCRFRDAQTGSRVTGPARFLSPPRPWTPDAIYRRVVGGGHSPPCTRHGERARRPRNQSAAALGKGHARSRARPLLDR